MRRDAQRLIIAGALLAAILGAASILVSVLFAIYSIFAKFVLHQSPKGFAALVLLITFLSGTLLFFLGLIGEYVGRIYEETKARPHYIIGRLIGVGSPVGPDLQRRENFSHGSSRL